MIYLLGMIFLRINLKLLLKCLLILDIIEIMNLIIKRSTKVRIFCLDCSRIKIKNKRIFLFNSNSWNLNFSSRWGRIIFLRLMRWLKILFSVIIRNFRISISIFSLIWTLIRFNSIWVCFYNLFFRSSNYNNKTK